MFSSKGFLKNRALLWAGLCLGVVFIALFIYIVLKPHQVVVPYKAVLQQNKLNVKGLEFKYILSGDAYANLLSTTAYVDILDNSVDLDNLSLEYVSTTMTLNANADNGSYSNERYLEATGNIKGTVDGIDFYTDVDGKLEYDYIEGVGEITNGIYLHYDNSSIFSKSASFDYTKNYVYFKDNVTVIYSE